MRDSTAPTGRLHIIVTDPRNGRVVDERRANNMVTLDGRQLLAQLWTGAVSVDKIKLGIGRGATAAKVSDKSLEGELQKIETTLGQAGGQQGRWVTEISATISGANTLEFCEAGLWIYPINLTQGATPLPGKGLPSAGVSRPPKEILYNRVVFDMIKTRPAFDMTLAWEIVF